MIRNKLVFLLTLLLSFSLIGTVWATETKKTAPTDTEKVARSWLGLIDKHDFGKSWKEASTFFRGAVPEETWVKQLEGVRVPLGKVKNRKLVSSQKANSLPGAPDGEYVVMTFQTSFANKKKASELVTAQKDTDGSWRIAGYFIK